MHEVRFEVARLQSNYNYGGMTVGNCSKNFLMACSKFDRFTISTIIGMVHLAGDEDRTPDVEACRAQCIMMWGHFGHTE